MDPPRRTQTKEAQPVDPAAEPTNAPRKVGSEHLPRHKGQIKKVRPRKAAKRAVKRGAKKKGKKVGTVAKVKRAVGKPRGPVRIGGHKVVKGTRENILLKISEHYTHQGVYIPVTVIRGTRPGPRLFLTAAIHGDEVNGVQIIREALDLIQPENLRGTVVAVPVVNRFGFVSHSRYMPDRRDLNRAFPGDARGSTTARVARIVFDEIVQNCDYGIDLHTAGYLRTNLPQVRGNMDDKAVRRMARGFGAEVILDNNGQRGTLRRAATEAGVPTIIYEAGETFRFERNMISKGVTGILNVMRELKMVAGKPSRPEYQIIVKASEWVRADHGGILETLVVAGSLVYKGDVVARIANPFGRTVDEVQAPFHGLVVGVSLLPMVNPGAPICHVVKLKKTLPTVAHHTERAMPQPVLRDILEVESPEVVQPGFEEEDIEG